MIKPLLVGFVVSCWKTTANLHLDFQYLELKALQTDFPGIPITFLSGSISRREVKDVLRVMEIPRTSVYVKTVPCGRKNLHFSVLTDHKDKAQMIAKILTESP